MRLSKSIPEPANTSAVPKTDRVGNSDWQPGASLKVMKTRATLLARIRDYFARNGVLEVDTPALSRFGCTDPAIESFRTEYRGPSRIDGLPLYLHTSPEFFMKRLLAAGYGPLYQLAHVFRDGEWGTLHNPEFMMLEWYRPGMVHHALMDEIDDLLAFVLDGFFDYQPANRISYRQWFLEATGLDPWVDGVEAFRRFAEHKLETPPVGMDGADLDTWLDLLVTHWLAPRCADQLLFVFDYPASQAALARICPVDDRVADRFELFMGDMELANGYVELTDAAEQRRRIDADLDKRQRLGRDVRPWDKRLLEALEHGLPDCAGVALGVERLHMVLDATGDIRDVMTFAFEENHEQP